MTSDGQKIFVSKTFDKLLDQSRLLVIKSREPIFYQGEIPRHALFLVNGAVKAYDIGINGDEKIVSFIAAGEFIPPAWVFNKSPVSLYYYDAFTDCRVKVINRSVVQQMIDKDFVATRTLLNRYIGLYTGAVQHINALTQSKSVDKILYILQYLTTRFGKPIASGKSIIPIRLTHQDIANMAGLTRETTSVELHKLKLKQIISYQNQRYTVNLNRLQTNLGSEEFNNYSY